LFTGPVWPCYLNSYDSKYTHIKIIIDENLKCKENVYSLLDEWRGYNHLYTDGSKTNVGIGASICDPQANKNIKYKIEANVSIMYAELCALFEALNYIKNINNNKFVVMTDCKSALQHVARCTSSIRGVPIAYSILETIQELERASKKIVIQWIPSHIGLLGNELADCLANEAILDGISYPTDPFYTDILPLLKSNIFSLWTDYFNKISLEKGIWYKTIQAEPLLYPWFETSKMDRVTLTTAFRVRSGHIPLNNFAFLLKKVPSPRCTLCGITEDVYHILMECVRNESLRRLLFQDHIAYNIGYCNSLLSYPHSEKARLIYKLVKLGLKTRI